MNFENTIATLYLLKNKKGKLSRKKEADFMEKEISHFYEALQFLAQKKNKGQNARAKWKMAWKNIMITKVLNVMKSYKKESQKDEKKTPAER